MAILGIQITCVKASQGFDWNQGLFFPLHSSGAEADWTLIDIFLPSSSEITIHNGIQKPETVHEIIITEEEYDSYLPS